MRRWQVRVRTIVDCWVPVEADTPEQAEIEALAFADNDDLNYWATVDCFTLDVEEDE